MEYQIHDTQLYSEEEYARVKWYLVNSGREGTQDEVFSVIRKGNLKNIQIRERLMREGIIDVDEELL
jgi:hypothetical protein